jgi:pimeloyl-ACP methyl ester carboxylesterase
LLATLTWARSQTEIDADRLFVIGASMGGAVGVSVAALDGQLRGVVTLGSPADGLRWLRDLWCRERGDAAWSTFMQSVEDDRIARASGKAPKFVALVGDFLPIDGPERAAAEAMLRANPGMLDVMALEVVDDLRLLNPETAAANLSTPALIVHGTADALVSSREAERLAGAGTAVRRVIVAGGEHQLLLGSHQEQVVDIVISWILDLVA